jgi:hypothetical protein
MDAVHNVYAFSNQGRHEGKKKARDSGLVAMKSVPYVARNFAQDQSYIAIVYEYVEEAANEPAAVEAMTSFLWLVGFSHSGSHAQNWKSGVLIDLADIVHPLGFGWKSTQYGPRAAAAMLRE